MRVRYFLITICLILVCNIKVFSEGNQDRSSDQSGQELDIFANEEKGLLRVDNNSQVNMILFAGRVEQGILLGGVRAMSGRNIDIAKINYLPPEGTFIINGISAEMYQQSRRISSEQILYSCLVTYNLKESWGSNFEIPGIIKENTNTYIYVSNETKFVLELRIDNIEGEVIAVLSPFEMMKRIKLEPAKNGTPYVLFDVYKYFDFLSGNIISFNTTQSKGQRIIPSDTVINPIVFRGPRNDSDINYITGYVQLINNTDMKLILKNGDTVLKQQQKNKGIVNPREVACYELSSMTGEIGQMYSNLIIEPDNLQDIKILRLFLQPGRIYDIDISLRNGMDLIYTIREKNYLEKNLENMSINLLF